MERGPSRAQRALQQRAQQLRQQAEQHAEQLLQQQEQRQQQRLTPIVRERTTRYNSNGFSEEQLRSIAPPAGSQRVQLVLRDPGYGKHGYRSTGWIAIDEVDLSTLEEDFGISLNDLSSVIFDNA